MKEVFIVHGYAASVNSHWFPWLAEKVRTELSLPSHVVSLPASKTPSLPRWLSAVDRAIPAPGEGTFLVAHSLGCITVLKYIEALPVGVRIGGVVLVSGFDEPLLLLPVINSFTAKRLDYSNINEKLGAAATVASSNDLLVPAAATARVAKALGAESVVIGGAGHFCARDGYREFPLLLDILGGMVQQSPL